MDEQEVFDLLDGGWITKRDKGCSVEIGDCDGDLSYCCDSTPESAWGQAVAWMLKALEDRANENSESNEPTLSAGERNPGL